MRQAQNAPAVRGDTSNYYSMDKQLEEEEQKKPLLQLLFMGFKIEDISSSLAERKSGTDFLLYPPNDDGSFGVAVRGENKFEKYLTGRLTLEIVSVDRPTYRNAPVVAGWLITSRAGWLLSFFPTGELVVLRMEEVRALVMPNLTRNVTTTAKNKNYLSWSVLEDVNYLLTNLPSARWLDLSFETGQTFAKKKLISGKALQRRCSVEELVEHMRQLPPTSEPLTISQEQLKDFMRQMAPKNLKKDEHNALMPLCVRQEAQARAAIPSARAAAAPAA